MKPVARIAAFCALLAAIFAAAALAGAAIDPDAGGNSEGPTHGGHSEASAPGGGHSDPAAGGGRTRASAAAGGGQMAAHASPDATVLPAGVASSQDGVRLVAARTRFAAGRASALRFRILDARGAVVRDFDVEQARRLHLIVVRRDLRRYQHLHPVQQPDGSWATQLTLPEAGVYRAFADFSVAGARHTLGVDLFVPGSFEPRDLPPASDSARVDGYVVGLREHGGELRFVVRRDGAPVGDLQPYLGAYGHLVALRDGDLAYTHVHPEPGQPPQIAFHTGAIEPGTYRLFLQFRHAGRVHTAAFTRVER